MGESPLSRAALAPSNATVPAVAVSIGGLPELSSPAKPEEIKPWQIILHQILELVPPPLGIALIVGLTLLGGVAGLIDQAYKDFDLRLALGSLWFLLALGTACILWLVVTILARKRLGWARLTGFSLLFLVVAADSGRGAWHMAQYEYNDLGFYQQTHWHRPDAANTAKVTHFEWRIEAVNATLATLRFKMAADPSCQYTEFQPPPPPARNSSKAGEIKAEWNACLYGSADSPEVIVENFSRGGSILFTLYPTDASINPVSCKLPLVRMTKEHC
jgi:hypothetical protein